MTTVSELVAKGDVPEEHKDHVKSVCKTWNMQQAEQLARLS